MENGVGVVRVIGTYALHALRLWIARFLTQPYKQRGVSNENNRVPRQPLYMYTTIPTFYLGTNLQIKATSDLRAGDRSWTEPTLPENPGIQPPHPAEEDSSLGSWSVGRDYTLQVYLRPGGVVMAGGQGRGFPLKGSGGGGQA